MTRVHTPDPGDERPGAAGALAGSLLNQGTAHGLEVAPPHHLSRTAASPHASRAAGVTAGTSHTAAAGVAAPDGTGPAAVLAHQELRPYSSRRHDPALAGAREPIPRVTAEAPGVRSEGTAGGGFVPARPAHQSEVEVAVPATAATLSCPRDESTSPSDPPRPRSPFLDDVVWVANHQPTTTISVKGNLL